MRKPIYKSFALFLMLCHRLWRGAAFVPLHGKNNNRLRNTQPAASIGLEAKVTSEEVRERLVTQLAILREKDRKTKVIKGESLKVLYEDNDLVVVNKPSGVLSVPSEQGIPSLAQTVFETVDHSLSSYDRMVVHRLGMDTSGCMIFAKSMDGLRGMNTLLRTREVTRQYEVLVCGTVNDDEGLIDLPLMRDYEFPPYMRVSTDEHQRALVDLDPAIVGKKLLEAPKASLTKFEVVAREELGDTKLPVTRLTLTSITGRTHQLNVHCAAIGHPIVADRVYGYGGQAATNGGLYDSSLRDDAASVELQQQIAAASTDKNMCVHAKRLSFRHPITLEVVSFESRAPF